MYIYFLPYKITGAVVLMARVKKSLCMYSQIHLFWAISNAHHPHFI